ncbi:hypothetical protein [Thermococcus sp.]
MGQKIYGGFISVRTPPTLPDDLNCLIAIWVSLSSRKEGSSSDKYFYQTSLGYTKEWGWHISAGSTNPQLSCNLHCGPFKIDGIQFKPKPNTVYELGVRFIPQSNGKNKVYLYFVDWSTSTLYNIFVLEDEDNPGSPVGGMLEAYTVDENELLKLGNNNAFKIENANWLIEPWTSTMWPHAYAYEGIDGENYYNVPDNIWRNIQIKLLNPGKLYTGYKVGGKHYSNNERIW